MCVLDLTAAGISRFSLDYFYSLRRLRNSIVISCFAVRINKSLVTAVQLLNLRWISEESSKSWYYFSCLDICLSVRKQDRQKLQGRLQSYSVCWTAWYVTEPCWFWLILWTTISSNWIDFYVFSIFGVMLQIMIKLIFHTAILLLEYRPV